MADDYGLNTITFDGERFASMTDIATWAMIAASNAHKAGNHEAEALLWEISEMFSDGAAAPYQEEEGN